VVGAGGAGLRAAFGLALHWDKLQDFCQDEDKNKEPLMRIDQKV
jgi:hypothetical protein